MRAGFAWGTGLAAVAAVLLSCQPRPHFVCSVDGQCGANGRCDDGDCSFLDDACSSGRRYGTYAQPALAGKCVDEEPPPGSSTTTTSGITTDQGSSTGGEGTTTSVRETETSSGSSTSGGTGTSTGMPDPPVETCDGIDNDRDGLIDEWSPENAQCDGCFLDQMGERVYWICEGPASWPDARQRCLDRGADLASIHDEEEDWALTVWVETWDTRYLWLGGTDQDEEGVWAWSDQTAWDYERWAVGQPDDGQKGEDCLHHRLPEDESAWNDLPCDREQAFICEAAHPE